MILYILYNADLLEIAGNDTNEDSLGYVDDVVCLPLDKILRKQWIDSTR
jgi:hypothetical protein